MRQAQHVSTQHQKTVQEVFSNKTNLLYLVCWCILELSRCHRGYQPS